MARPPLRAFVLASLALLVVAGGEAASKKSNQEVNPDEQADSSAFVENGEDESSNIVMHFQTNMVGEAGGLDAVPTLLKELGFSIDPVIAGDSDNSVSSGSSGSAMDGGIEHLDKLQSSQGATFFSPFLVQGAPEGPSFASFFGPIREDQSGHLRQQMLQNVASSRFGPAVMAAKKQDSDSVVLDGISDTDDQSWDIEVIFVPSDPAFQNGNGEFFNSQFQILDEGSFEEQDGYEVVSRRRSRSSVLCTIAFITLLIGCILTLLLCVRQGCELRRAMKDTSQKAGEMSFRGAYERRPLLSDIDKAFAVDNDGYTNILIKPVDCEPAIKSHYPAYLKTQI